jgi:hypothetical protein
MRKTGMKVVAGFIVIGLCGCVTTADKNAPKSIEEVRISVKKEPNALVPASAPKPIKVQAPVVAQKPAVSPIGPILPERSLPLADLNDTILKYLIFILIFLFAGFAWYYRAARRLIKQKKIKVKHHSKKKK